MEKKHSRLLKVSALLGIVLQLIPLICIAVLLWPSDGGKGDGGSGLAARLTDEELSRYNPDAPYKMYGNSRPIDIQPRPFLHITAGQGAFEHDVQIQVTDVSESTMERLDEKIASQGRGELLFAYDIDAGLSPDEVIPGKYNVEFDLSKLGVPADLQPFMQVVRVASDGSIETLNSQVKGDKLSYAASQNSVIALVCGLASNAFVAWFLWEGANFTYRSWMAICMNTNGHPWLNLLAFAPTSVYRFITDKRDMVGIHVTDEFGNFNVVYRYSETERGDRYKQYVEKSERLTALVKKLHREAEQKFDKKHPGWKSKWFVTEGDKAQQRMEIAQMFYDLMMKNDEVQRLAKDDDLQTPQSILDIIKGVKIGNRFCREKLGMKPLSHEFDVYVADSTIIGNNKSEAMRTAPDGGCNPHLTVCYNYVVKTDTITKKIFYDTDQYDALVLTMTHEAFHLYQSEYIVSNLFKDMRFFEATASVVEYQFGDWMKEKGYINYDPCSDYGAKRLSYTRRDNHHLLGWTLTKPLPSVSGVDDLNVDGGYMLGDFLEFLLKKRGMVSFPDMMAGYAYNKPLSQSLMDIFGISNEGAFTKLYEEFCEQHITEILTKQQGVLANASYKWITLPEHKHDMDNCVVRIKDFGHERANLRLEDMPEEMGRRIMGQQAYGYAVKTLTLYEWSILPGVKKDDKGTPLKLHYTLFAVPSPKIQPNQLKFSFLDSYNDNKYAANNLYFSPCAGEYKREANAVLLFRPNIGEVLLTDEDYWIDIVALYEPTLHPKFVGMSKDRKGLLVDTKDEPAVALERQGYVSGMQLCVTNNKTKAQKNFIVPLDRCGETVKLPYQSLGITDKEKVDVTMQARWFYRPDGGKTTYYGAAGKPITYKQNGTKGTSTEAADYASEPGEAPEEMVAEDGEEEGVLMVATLSNGHTHCKMTVMKNHFRLEIPNYSYEEEQTNPLQPGDGVEYRRSYKVTGTVIEGKCSLTDDLLDMPVITAITKVGSWTENCATRSYHPGDGGALISDGKWTYAWDATRQAALQEEGPIFEAYGRFNDTGHFKFTVAVKKGYSNAKTAMGYSEKEDVHTFDFSIIKVERK